MSLAPDSQSSNEAQLVSGTAPKFKLLVSQIYAQSWSDYRHWCAKGLPGRLTRQKTRPPSLPSPNAPTEALSGDWQVTDYDTPQTYFLPPADTITGELVRPYAPYESCTPVTRNFMIGDDPDYLPFIPFADDPSYAWQFDNEQHHFVAWAIEDTSDLEAILFSTVQRLTTEFGLSEDDIDATRVLPGASAAIRKLGQKRDFPKWTHAPKARTHYSPETIDYFLENFCNNLNCIHSFCNTHITVSPPKRVTPRLLTPSSPCGDACFLVSSVNVAENVDLVRAAMECAREATPCDLATICRVPCNQVAACWLPTTPVSTLRDKSAPKFRESADVYVPELPCKHDGPCVARAGCICFTNHAHCHRRCGCPLSCRRQWKGCACAAVPGATCATKKCPCFKGRVECDPEVCLPCGASGDGCRNTALQRGRRKETEVRQSAMGLGLFILEPCAKDDMISEYVGELVLNPTIISRDPIASHRNRSYVFDINPEFSIDGMRAGNETRYINHSPNPNCYTLVYLVNNEHRVGVFAAHDIPPGAELFINYGPRFFKKSHETAEES